MSKSRKKKGLPPEQSHFVYHPDLDETIRCNSYEEAITEAKHFGETDTLILKPIAKVVRQDFDVVTLD